MENLLAIKKLVEEAIREHDSEQQWIYVSAVLILFLVSAAGAYFGSYLKRKGENLATKEDIKELTHLTEQVRNEYAKVLENFSYENRLRLAALDRRLEAHQQAFALWYRLTNSVFKQEQVNEL